MPSGFDSVLTSNDLSLDRVLNAGLPVTLVFYDHELPADLTQAMDELARREAGKALIVKLARADAPQAMSRLGVRALPAVVTVRKGNTVSSQGGITATDLKAHAAYLLGQGPMPAPRVSRPVRQPAQAAAGKPVAVNEADFEREVLRSELPVLVDFWAPWCGPCRMVAPTLDALAREHGSVLKIAKVNVDENPGLAARYGAMSIPTMMVVKDGREVDRWVGALPDRALRGRVSRWIQPAPQAA
jgi:thioredoxin